MKRIITGFIFLLSGFLLKAQFSETFNDGDFTSNPQWQGETSKFMVNASYQLQLNDATPSDIAHLSTSVSMADSTVWTFYLKLNFSPSANNRVRVYLQSNQADLEGSLQGYFIQIGQSGSSDGIDLYRQNGSNISLIAAGIAGHGAVNPELRIKVIRDFSGNWSVYSDLNAGNNFTLEANGSDNSFPQGQFLGVYCKHTTSNANQFFFDDFSVSPIHIDTIKPQISKIEILSSTALNIYFSESLEASSAGNTSHYQTNQNANPSSAQVDANNPALVHLLFSTPFISGQADTLRINNISDLNGNIQLADAFPFMYYETKYGDILINEIMADPSPAQGLPEQEYVEIINNTGFDLNLSNWVFADATSSHNLPVCILKSDSLAILCDPANSSFFTLFGQVIAIPGFPALNNSGDDLSLFDQTGKLISTISYNDTWYRDDLKKNGGWSLEQIDPLAHCQGAGNWIASINQSGGSPGKVNSVAGLFPDTTAPQVLYATVSGKKVNVYFSEELDTAYSLDSSNYSINQNMEFPETVALLGGHRDKIQLTLVHQVDTGIVYTLSMTNLADCSGNQISMPDTVIFAIPYPVDSGDIILNEILFNPKSGGVDYLELYNRSDKVLDLRSLEYAEIDPISENQLGTARLSGKPYLMMPGEYFAITSNKSITLFDYYTPNPRHVIQLSSLPNWADDEGIVRIQKDSLHFIDQLHYYSYWHFALIDDENGVSLERIHPDTETQDSANWHSAASSVGYGTPAYINSQYDENVNNLLSFSVEPEVFSPDQDGYHDYLTINYKFDAPGYMLSIRVFDTQGRLVNLIANNKLAAQSGFFTWDGSDLNANIANTGIYIISADIYNLEGSVSHFRLKCVLAKQVH